MKKEISSPMLQETIDQLDKVYNEICSKTINVSEAQAKITAIKHKIQSIALDWLYSKKQLTIHSSTNRVREIENTLEGDL